MTAAHSSTDTDAPNASHDHAGWWRRGDQRNSSAIAAIISASASGQRTTAQTVATRVVVEPVADRLAERERDEREHGEHARP